MRTKHEQILAYIETLLIGDKISVRRIAKELQVSEGTAYRAIKEAENQSLVSTIERVGTIRIERKVKENFERLTFAEVVNIIDGQVVGGKSGLHKTLTKFVIGAMQLDDMMRYIDPGNLLIVGNRSKAQLTSLRSGAAVLITGGFDASDEVKLEADSRDLPVISTSYDTFTVATMINRAIYDQLIKKEVLFIEDIYVPLQQTDILQANQSIGDYHAKNAETNHGGFPVVDTKGRLIGIVTSRDVMGKEMSELIEKVMTKQPISATLKTSVASASHRMIWEGIDLMPVVDEGNYLLGIISRQDVLKGLQLIQRQPQHGETLDDMVKSQLIVHQNEYVEFTVTPQMTNQFGAISYGAFVTVLTEAGEMALKSKKKVESIVENVTIYFLKPIQMDSILHVKPTIIDSSRRFVKMEIDVHIETSQVGKAMVTFQLLDR
ncbi:DRTGG domain-containing protein [Paenisporosarcina cavernae]|uniref:CBS domain-containing protein n=1 Tax=Paenisporosarcina cavernae TaxID=2320858 RepID=A0A385YWF5_9BACL|nr:DRTGG domain-containing protein [Paenisporosarcina cavernae]AYC29842.1 CBS domain-containing protein [Paenisporosarcina cavernae]